MTGCHSQGEWDTSWGMRLGAPPRRRPPVGQCVTLYAIALFIDTAYINDGPQPSLKGTFMRAVQSELQVVGWI